MLELNQVLKKPSLKQRFSYQALLMECSQEKGSEGDERGEQKRMGEDMDSLEAKPCSDLSGSSGA